MIDDVVSKHKMQYALWRMMRPTGANQRNYRVTSKHYQKAKADLSASMRKNNPMFNSDTVAKWNSNNPMHRPEVVAKFRGRKRPAQSTVAAQRNEKYWTIENRQKASNAQREKMKTSGFVYQLMNVITGQAVHFYMLASVKPWAGLKSINIGKLCQKKYMLEKLPVSSVVSLDIKDLK
jgi:hypothetical protein